MKKIVLAVLFVVLVSGCSESSNMELLVESYKGMDINADKSVCVANGVFSQIEKLSMGLPEKARKSYVDTMIVATSHFNQNTYSTYIKNIPAGEGRDIIEQSMGSIKMTIVMSMLKCE